MIKGVSKSAPKAAKRPRISVNKLAEYLEAIPTRRKKIVEDAKYPEKFVVTRYKEARDVIKSYLAGEVDEDFVLERIEEFEDAKSHTDFQEQDNKLSGISLESLLESDIAVFEGVDISVYEDKNELVEIAGVDISINPDLIVKKVIDKTSNVGAIKLHLSKNNALSSESQKIVAVMLMLYTDKFVKGKKEVATGKLCFSFDVFAQTIESSPPSFKHRLKKIEAACEEIALWWESM